MRIIGQKWLIHNVANRINIIRLDLFGFVRAWELSGCSRCSSGTEGGSDSGHAFRHVPLIKISYYRWLFVPFRSPSLSRFSSFNMHDNANLLMQSVKVGPAHRGNFSCSMHNLAEVPFMRELLVAVSSGEFLRHEFSTGRRQLHLFPHLRFYWTIKLRRKSVDTRGSYGSLK